MEQTETTIARLKEIEEQGNKMLENAEREKALAIENAKRHAIEMVENFESGWEKIAVTRVNEIEKEHLKKREQIIKKAKEDAKKIKNDLKIKEAVSYIFQKFEKEVKR